MVCLRYRSPFHVKTLLHGSVARDLDSQIYMRNTGHKAPTYRQIAGLHYTVQ
jgi:hypothetical protein